VLTRVILTLHDRMTNTLIMLTHLPGIHRAELPLPRFAAVLPVFRPAVRYTKGAPSAYFNAQLDSARKSSEPPRKDSSNNRESESQMRNSADDQHGAEKVELAETTTRYRNGANAAQNEVIESDNHVRK
jgi:hypothetical protein